MAEQTAPKVAVVGTGRMGSAIAEAILRAGFDLTVYSRTPSKAVPLVALGARSALSIAEAVAQADVVLTSLHDDASVVEVVRGKGGLLESMRRGSVHVGATTISARLADELARWHEAAGTRYVAGPVVGRRELALTRTMTTFAAGDPQAIGIVRPVLEAYGPIRVVGARHSAANVLKLVNNFITIAWIELMSEVYAFGEKQGVDRQLAHEILTWALDKPGLRNYSAEIRDRDFDGAGFELGTGLKDVRLMLDAAAEAGAPLRYAELIRSKMLAAVEHGLGGKDWAAISEVARREAGLDSLA